MLSTHKFDTDVLIIGGGVAGCAAATVAARRGLRVLLLEREISLGGLATNGYVTGIAGMVEGFSREWIERLNAEGDAIMRPKLPIFDPEKGKLMLERMILEQGGRILYGTYVVDVNINEEGNKIQNIVCYSKSGRMEIAAGIYIDATGDADVAAAAGVPYEEGSPEYAGLNMSTTLAFRMANVNFAKYRQAQAEWMKKELENYEVPRKYGLYAALQEEAVANGDLPFFIFPTALIYPVPNTPENDADVTVMTTHSFYTRNTDVEDLTRQVIEQHQQMLMVQKFMHKYVPGFENARITGIANLHGVRDSRRIVGEYVFKAADIVSGTKFEDGIARFPEMLDTHHPTSPRLGFKRHIHVREPQGSALCREPICGQDMHPFVRPVGLEARPDPRDYCEIPFRSLIPRKIDNLLLVGRCVSAEFDAVGAVRVIAPSMSTGQAAAIAAQICLEEGLAPKQIDGKRIRKAMIEEEGIPLDELPDGHWATVRETEGKYVVSSDDTVGIRTKDNRIVR